MPAEAEPVTITVSGLPRELHEKLKELAARDDRSVSSFIRRELEMAVAEHERAKRAQHQEAA